MMPIVEQICRSNCSKCPGRTSYTLYHGQNNGSILSFIALLLLLTTNSSIHYTTLSFQVLTIGYHSHQHHRQQEKQQRVQTLLVPSKILVSVSSSSSTQLYESQSLPQSGAGHGSLSSMSSSSSGSLGVQHVPTMNTCSSSSTSALSAVAFGAVSTDNTDYVTATTTASAPDILLKESQSRTTVMNTSNRPSLSWVSETLVPILSTSLLITSNTVGAGCLILPELARDGPGFAITSYIFVASYVVNLLSGLVIAQIAINQKEQSGTDTPSSFKEFAQVNLKSDTVAVVVSALSMFVNACVLTFDLDRVGMILSSLLRHLDSVSGYNNNNNQLSSLSSLLTNLPTSVPEMAAPIFSTIWALGIVSLMCTQTSKRLSQVSNVLVAALFLSFGALLLPGLANVEDPIGTITAGGNFVLSNHGEGVGNNDYSALLSSITYTSPIILMSMIYQNIVPTVTKLLHYDRFKTTASLVLGSSIPLVLYLSWIYANLGGGIDISSVTDGGGGITAALLTVFSLVTIGGSSLCGSVSMAEELETFFPSSATASKATIEQQKKVSPLQSSAHHEQQQQEQQQQQPAAAFQLPAAIVSVAVPLGAAFMFTYCNGYENGSSTVGLTDALAIAGSIGSPLLYGAIPAYIAYQQMVDTSQTQTTKTKVSTTQPIIRLFSSSPPPLSTSSASSSSIFSSGFKISRNSSNTRKNLVPEFSLPILGVLSTGYVGQELFQQATAMLSMGT